MSTNFAFVLSLVWVLLILGTTVLNHFKGRTQLFYSSIFLLSVYALIHLININWLLTIPAVEAIKLHYLFYSFSAAALSIGLFWFNRKSLTLMMSLAIFLLGLEAMLHLAMHVDRNIMALNFKAMPNLTDSTHWFLWDIKNVVATLNNPVLILAVVLGKVYKIGTTDATKAAEIGEDVERFIQGWEDSELKDELLQMTSDALDNLLYHGFKGHEPKTESGLALLEKAIQLSHYEPDRSHCGKFSRFMYWLRS